MIFPYFKRCLAALQTYTVDMLTANKDALSDQQTSLATEKTKLSGELKKTTVNAARANANLTDRINLIANGELLEYRTNLKLQQQQSVESAAAMLTISRIVEKRKEIERLSATIEENKIKMKVRANRMKSLMKEQNLVAAEIQFMTDVLAVSTFLNTQGLAIDDVAEYDQRRLYDLFSSEV